VYQAGLFIILVGSGIADVGIGERDDLAAVRRVGEDFLITGHRGIENHFAGRLAIGADCLAPELGAVFEYQKRWISQGILRHRRAKKGKPVKFTLGQLNMGSDREICGLTVMAPAGADLYNCMACITSHCAPFYLIGEEYVHSAATISSYKLARRGPGIGRLTVAVAALL
jgi:hypothetical protein